MSLPHRIPACARVRYVGRDWDNRHRHTPTPLHETIAPAGEPGIPARYRLATYAVCALVGVLFWTAVFAAVLS